LQDAFNEQMNAELYSAYLYLSMAGWFDGRNLPGGAHWMRLQAREEAERAMKFYHYLVARGGQVSLAAIEEPKDSWSGPEAVFQEAYAHEQKVTARIHNLVDLAAGEKDHAAGVFLQWFVSEQVEEEANADAIVQELKRVGPSEPGLSMVDRELDQRADDQEKEDE